jgi:hypothetical protein
MQSQRNGVRSNGGLAEEQPLLKGRKPPSWSLSTRTKATLGAHVTRDWADIVLLSCYTITGLLDSSANSIWGSFVSMQTGMSTRCHHSPSNDLPCRPLD